MINGVKVFTTSHHRYREIMGETITDWLAGKPGIEIIKQHVVQSSDVAYHCFTVVLFYRL